MLARYLPRLLLRPLKLSMLDGRKSALGPELITNGLFLTDSGWTKGAGWTIAGGVAVATGVATGGVAVSQTIALIAGRTYQVSFEIVSISAGAVRATFSGGTAVNGTTRSTVGVFTQTMVANTGNTSFRLNSFTVPLTCTIDNISVKEVLA